MPFQNARGLAYSKTLPRGFAAMIHSCAKRSLLNAAFLMELANHIPYLPAMSQTLLQRVRELEKKVAKLSRPSTPLRRQKDWRRTVGIFANDPDFDEAVRLGRKYRKQQTYEKEIARS